MGDSSQLPEVVSSLSPAKEVAVDVEADSMHHFKAKLCFVQLGTDRDIFLMDTLRPGVTPRSLDSMFADPAVTKFFHAAGGDLQYLAEAGVRVKGLFDTHRAATLLGWPKVGLADLVKEKLGQTLKKEHQQADFSLRPLPPELRERSSRTRIYAPVWRDEAQAAFAARIDRLHAAIEARRVLRLAYRDEGGRCSEREVEPLCLAFWGGKWTLGTWCRLRGDFRNFRPDRIDGVAETGECFADRVAHNLEAYLAAMRGYYAGMD